MGGWLITRPRADAVRTADAVRAAGGQAVMAPVLRLVLRRPDRDPATALRDTQALLLTSMNAVRGWAAATADRGVPVLTVGDRTAAAARAAGFRQVRSAGGDSADLVSLALEVLTPGAGALVHPSSPHGGQGLIRGLAAAGFRVRPLVVYEVLPVLRMPRVAAGALADPTTRGAAFFSPRSAEVFVSLAQRAGLTDRFRRLTALCISAAVADRLEVGAWRGNRVATRPTLEAMIAEMRDADRG